MWHLYAIFKDPGVAPAALEAPGTRPDSAIRRMRIEFNPSLQRTLPG